jgi:hypothetical protein
MVEVFTRFRDEELEMLRRIFRQGKQRGEFTGEGIEKAAEIYFHIFHGLRLRYVQFAPRTIPFDREGFEQLRDEVNRATEIFLRGIGADLT